MTHTTATLATLATLATPAMAEPLPTRAEVRQAAEAEAEDVVSEGLDGVMTPAQLASAVRVSRALPFGWAVVWTALQEAPHEICWIERVNTPAGPAWVGVCY